MDPLNKYFVCDLEADSLVPSVIWCIGVIDTDTGEELSWGPDALMGFVQWYNEKQHDHDGKVILVGHNFLSYDTRVLNKLLGMGIRVEQVEDTLILSRLFDMTRFNHSLGSWGETLGFAKGDHTDFSRYTPEMHSYMMQDCRVNLKLWRYLRTAMQGKWSEFSIRLEHNTQDFLNHMKKCGFPLDTAKVYATYEQIKEEQVRLEHSIKEAFPPQLKVVERYVPKFTKNGTMSLTSAKKIAKYGDLIKRRKDGSIDLMVLEEFNLGSVPQVVERMNQAGWEPVDFTDKGNPRLTEANFETLPDTAPEGAKAISRWKLLTNRLAVLDGWLDAYNPITKSIHGDVKHIGAITHRMSHTNPQMANIPATRNEFGKEMRSCLWSGGDGYVQVGVDISGIQLRILAHYLNDPEYTEAVCNGKEKDGTDIHSVHMRILQEVAPECTRDNAKTYIYAMLLGAGDAKLGSILGLGTREGRATKETLFRRIPAFKQVQRMCSVAAKRGYMIGIDGRRTPIKSEHFALSAYLQCGEAVVMKQALVSARERIKYKWFPMAVVHDEIQSRVLAEYGEQLGKDMVKCIEDAGTFFELRSPVTGNYKIGNNWSETH